jgi:hypothetical protein
MTREPVNALFLRCFGVGENRAVYVVLRLLSVASRIRHYNFGVSALRRSARRLPQGVSSRHPAHPGELRPLGAVSAHREDFEMTRRGDGRRLRLSPGARGDTDAL